MSKKSKQLVLTKGRTIALVSALILIVSALLPWGVTDEFSVSGLNFTEEGISGDGLVTITIGIAALILIFVKKIPLWVSFVLSLIALLIGLNDFSAMNEVVVELDGRLGIGLYTTVLSSISMALGILLEILEFHDDGKKLYYVDK